MKTIEEIVKSIPEGKHLEWVNGVLTMVDDQPTVDERPITERVKSYEDACEVLGCKPIAWERTSLIEHSDDEKVGNLIIGLDESDIAYFKLQTIVKALNEDPEFPRFVEGEYRWFPYLVLYTQKEIDEMDEEDRKDVLLVGGYAHYAATAGVACSHTDPGWSLATAHFGARLALKSRELAEYCGKQFLELWSALNFRPVKK